MRKVLIICGAGASSAFMAKNIRIAVKERNLDYKFIARSDSELDEYISDIDMLLIGPHLSYMYQDMVKYAKPYHVPVYVIDQKAYGSLDGHAVVDFVETEFSK